MLLISDSNSAAAPGGVLNLGTVPAVNVECFDHKFWCRALSFKLFREKANMTPIHQAKKFAIAKEMTEHLLGLTKVFLLFVEENLVSLVYLGHH